MTDLSLEQTQAVVAQQLIANLIRDQVGDLWELYPDIGEHDWMDIQRIALEMADDFDMGDSYPAAYAVLEGRADPR